MKQEKEKEIEEFMKQKAEEIPVPESLSPENMVKRIKKEREGSYPVDRIQKERAGSYPVDRTQKERADSYLVDRTRKERSGSHPVKKWMYRICASAAVFACGALIAYGGLYGFAKSQNKTNESGLKGRESLCMELIEQEKERNMQFAAQKEWFQWAKENGMDPTRSYEIYDWVEMESMQTNDTAMKAPMDTGKKYNDVSQKDESDYSTTNVQVEGIDEADIVKTDGEYLYILAPDKIHIMDTKGDLEEVSAIYLHEGKDYDYDPVELYVRDQQMVILERKQPIYFNCYEEDCIDLSEEKAVTRVLIYDISNKEKPKLLKEIVQDGVYMSSRVKEDYLYLFTEYTTYIPKNIQDYDKYVPRVGNTELCYEDVCILPEGDSSDSLLVSVVDLKKKEIADKIMLTSGSDVFYVSDENIYCAVSDYRDGKRYSEIVKISYDKNEIEFVGKTEVEGSIYDQYFMDEKDGYLRMVVHVYDGREDEISRLYVLDQDLNEVGRIDDIAPGENLYSCRFMGEMAYFVTFRRVDPLFAADLSDPANPVMVGQLKIPGFSEYLQPYGDGLLLGIGYDVDEESNRRKGVKLTMFDISNPADIEELTSSYLPECSYFDQEPKAILASAKKNIIGISANRYDGDQYYYCFSYEDGEFVKNTEESIEYSRGTRGVYIDEVLYVANAYEVKAVSLKDFSLEETLKLK